MRWNSNEMLSLHDRDCQENLRMVRLRVDEFITAKQSEKRSKLGILRKLIGDKTIRITLRPHLSGREDQDYPKFQQFVSEDCNRRKLPFDEKHSTLISYGVDMMPSESEGSSFGSYVMIIERLVTNQETREKSHELIALNSVDITPNYIYGKSYHYKPTSFSHGLGSGNIPFLATVLLAEKREKSFIVMSVYSDKVPRLAWKKEFFAYSDILDFDPDINAFQWVPANAIHHGDNHL